MKDRWRVQRGEPLRESRGPNKKMTQDADTLHQDITDRQKPWPHCILGSAVPRRMKTLENGGVHRDAAADGSHDLFVRRLIYNDRVLRCSTVPKYLGTKKRTLVTRQTGNQARRIRHHESDDSEYSMIIALGMMTEPSRIREKHKAAPRRANSLDHYYFMKVMTNESRCF